MYQKILAGNYCHIVIQYVDEQPHAIAAWGNNRDHLDKSVGELICIHSLPDHWGKGYGSELLEYVLEQAFTEYTSMILWVFEKNKRARRLYEKFGFVLTGKTNADTKEVQYEKYSKEPT